MARRNSGMLFGLAAMALAGGAQAQAPSPGNDPAAAFQRYLDAVNAADVDKLRGVISDAMGPYSYSTCTPQMTSKACFIQFVEQTIIARHGSLVSPRYRVEGDAVDAVIEVRHDATRAAKAARLLGTDFITVRNNQIVSFKFVTDPNDAVNQQITAFNKAQAAAK